jgi:hypothetical protein
LVGQETGFATATCPAGTKLVGGGAEVVQPTNSKGAISVSGPTPQSGTPTGWRARAVVIVAGVGGGSQVGVIAYAICAS